MFVNTVSWTIHLAFFGFTWYWIQKKGFPKGLWLPWFASLLLVPIWIGQQPFSLPVEITSASCVGLVGLFWYFRYPEGSKPPFRWLWSDFCLLAFFCSMILSQYVVGDLRPLTAPEMARNILLPYFIGRVFLGSPRHILQIAPFVSILVIGIGLYGIIEALTKYNLMVVATNKVFGNLEAGEGFRWGVKRAQGNLTHPIYFSLMLVLMLPWVLESYHSYRKWNGPIWLPVSPIIALLAIILSVSRGGQLAAMIVLATDFFYRVPKARSIIIIIGICGALGYFLGREELIKLLEQAANETEKTFVTIDGKQYAYSGTRHRDLLPIIYQNAIEEGQWFGWGYELKNIPLEASLPGYFKSIDDHYLYTQLRYGRLGISLLGLVILCTLIYLIRLLRDPEEPTGGFLMLLAGAFVAVTIILRSVAMMPDFGWCYYFTIGQIAQLYSWRLDRLEIKQNQQANLFARPRPVATSSGSYDLVIPKSLNNRIED